MKECRSFVFRFIGIVIFMVVINIAGFNIFQNQAVYKIIERKNEKILKKNINVVERYIEEKKMGIFNNSKRIMSNIESKIKNENITEEEIINGIMEENSININYYIEIFNRQGKIIATSPGYIEKIESFNKKILDKLKKRNEFCEITTGENNVYIKSILKFKNNEYIAVVSYKLSEDFFDRVKEYITGEVNIYNKNLEIVLTTVKGEKQEKIKQKSEEIKQYNRKKTMLYFNKNQSGVVNNNGEIIYEVLMTMNNEKKDIKKFFYFFAGAEILFFIIMIIVLLRFMKQITETDKEFWKKMKMCMLGKDDTAKKHESDTLDYNIAFYNAKEIFIKNIYETLNCLEKREDIKEKIHKLKDLTEIYNFCFENVKNYRVEDIDVVEIIKNVSDVCNKYNIIVDIRKNRSKMYSTFEKNSIKYIFISVVYRLSEMYNSIKININVEDYGRKIFIRFKAEDTGITLEDTKCMNLIFNKEFIDYLIMINNMGFAEKNGVVEISMNV